VKVSKPRYPGEITLAKTILRDYINATVGFTGLAEATHIPPKSLMRMFSPAGNPHAANLFEIVSFPSASRRRELPPQANSQLRLRLSPATRPNRE